MLSAPEIKASTIYHLARYVGEPILAVKLPPYREDVRGIGVSDETDVFYTAARNAFTNLQRAKSPQERAEALVDLAQQAINGSRFRQARSLVKEVLDTSISMPVLDRIYYQARAWEKSGWLADYETGYNEAVGDFQRVRNSLNIIGRERWEQRHFDLFSTTTHFLGRARLGLACQGINPEYNLQEARLYFDTDLERFEELRRQGDPRPANEGFQHLWLAACDLTNNSLEAASNKLHKTGELFDEFLIDNPRSGIRAHWYLLNGLLELRKGDPQAARDSFSESVVLRTQVEKYPMGLALAEMGVARTYLDERKFMPALVHIKRAVQVQPAVLLYALNGRPVV